MFTCLSELEKIKFLQLLFYIFNFFKKVLSGTDENITSKVRVVKVEVLNAALFSFQGHMKSVLENQINTPVNLEPTRNYDCHIVPSLLHAGGSQKKLFESTQVWFGQIKKYLCLVLTRPYLNLLVKPRIF